MGLSRRAVLSGAACLLVEAKARAQEPWAAADRLGAALVRENRAPGLSVALSRGGTLAYSRSFGVADVLSGRRAEPSTPFRIASVTKPMVGALFLLLERDGLLSLADPLARWIPGFPRASEVSLRALLAHTSGLGEYTRIPLDRLTRDAARDYSADEIVERMAATRPLFAHEPGRRWDYSNTGYVLLGVVAERATGTPFGALLKRRLFEPAGLRNTAWDHPPSAVAASGHVWRGRRFQPIPYVSASFVGASGAVRSTAADLCAWGDALFDSRLLREGERVKLLSPVMPPDGRRTPAYGLGVFTGEASGRRVVWHHGSTAGFAADWRHYPDQGITIAMVANADATRMGSAPRAIRAALLAAVPGI